jgi:hypothetical protein
MSRLIVTLLLAALGTSGFAQEPALGRLFLTPEQRAVLDNARRNKIRAEALAATPVKKPKIPPAQSVTINGIVSRSDGESTVWVNGRPTEGQTEDGMRVTISPGSQSSVVLREPAKGKQVRLKVGQRADLISGRIEEPYEQRRTTAAPPASSDPARAEHASAAKGNRQPDERSIPASRGERDSEQQAIEDPEGGAAGDQRGDH